MVFPCRYCSQTQVNKHTHWRTCIVLQVSCFLHLQLQHDRVHGGSGDVCSGASLLRRGVSIPAADGAQEGARRWNSGSEKGTSGVCLTSQYGHHVCWPDEPSASGQGERSPERKGKGSKGAKGQTSRGWSSYQGRDWNQTQWSTPWPSQSAELPDLVHRLSQIVVKHEYAINNLKQDSTVYLFIKPGAQGLLPILFNTSEKWNRVQREHPEQTEESLRIVLLKAFLLELGQRLRNYKESEEAQAAAKELGWLTEDGRWKAVAWNPTVGALEEVPKGHTLDHGCHRGGDGGTQETGDTGQHLPVPVHQGPDEGATNSMGTAGSRGQHARLRSQDLGDHSILDRLFGIACSRLSLAEGTWRTFTAGTLDSLVNPLSASSSQPGSLTVPYALSLSSWCVAEDLFGLSQVLQCLLWTVQLDQQRRPQARGSSSICGIASANIPRRCYNCEVICFGHLLPDSGVLYRCLPPCT